MLKGVNKKVVEVIDIDNEYFERAILFVKPTEQKHDEKVIKERANLYIKGINYVPKRENKVTALLFSVIKVAISAGFGAVFASILLQNI